MADGSGKGSNPWFLVAPVNFDKFFHLNIHSIRKGCDKEEKKKKKNGENSGPLRRAIELEDVPKTVLGQLPGRQQPRQTTAQATTAQVDNCPGKTTAQVGQLPR